MTASVWSRWRRPQAAAPAGARRVAYLAPDNDTPVGGVKVIYRHVQVLRSLGCDAYVMHFKRGFRCTWFENDAPVLHYRQLRDDDFVVVPEVMPHRARELHARCIGYAMLVQNGYLLNATEDMPVVAAAYRHARTVLSISDDTSEMLRLVVPDAAARIRRIVCAVDPVLFRPQRDKPMVVTYMPRKMPQHARLITQHLAAQFPAWRFTALDNLREAEVAAALRASRIFLAFSEYEGLSLPPIEAAMAGNLVLGYHGWGGRSYWSEPNFQSVDFGDVRGFFARFPEVQHMACENGIEDLLAPGIARLAATFSFESEAEHLRRFATESALLPAAAKGTIIAS